MTTRKKINESQYILRKTFMKADFSSLPPIQAFIKFTPSSKSHEANQRATEMTEAVKLAISHGLKLDSCMLSDLQKVVDGEMPPELVLTRLKIRLDQNSY